MGTFNLIREGALPVRSGRELAESLNVITHPQLGKAVSVQQELGETVFSEEERMVLERLSTDLPARIDTIADRLEMQVADLFVLLLNLELKGHVQQCSGQQFIRIAD